MQMLQYYPHLLTLPPLTDAEFSCLPSLTISTEALGEYVPDFDDLVMLMYSIIINLFINRVADLHAVRAA